MTIVLERTRSTQRDEGIHRSAQYINRAAGQLRIPVDEYKARIAAGLRHCWACKMWHPIADMTKNSRTLDGIGYLCEAKNREFARDGMRALYARRRAGREDAVMPRSGSTAPT